MTRAMVCLGAAVVLCLAAAALCAAPPDGPAADEPKKGDAGPPRAENVWGRVKDIELNQKKLALEVETEESKEPIIVIFQATEDTKIRRQEEVKKFEDLRKGNLVIVWYRPAAVKGGTPTALFIRLTESFREFGGRRPHRPR